MSERFRVVWTDVAVNDLLAIVDYVADHHGVGAAEDLYQRVRDAAETLETMPRRGRVVPELSAEGIHTYRELLVGPYRVVFGLRGSDAVVFAAVDGRRDLAELLVERALRRP
ncbi:MAG: type II toxin-antitoxin system RelE/ParE family toxin [Egibacteraceae bacterium]